MAIIAVQPICTVARAADLPRPQSRAPAAAVTLDPKAVSPNQFAFVTERLSQWNVMLGGGAMFAPKFEGSNEFEVKPVPFVSATFGDWLKVDPRGISASVYTVGNLSLSGKLGYDLGRSQDDSAHLRGLGDVDAGAVVGAQLAYKFGALKLYGEINRTIGGSDGLQAKFGADLGYKYERFLLAAGASATWADSKYMTTYFGITPTQSVNSGLPAFNIGAGLKRFDVSASVTYMATENWLIRAQAGFGYLLGDVADSPIVQQEAQPFGMLTIGYKF
jgi:outer membrane scaffolding protein for murein synthesis (MipA/OmpV family)